MVGPNAKLKILEHRQQRIAEVRAKYEWLMKELEMTKQYLMLDPNKWLSECKARGSFASLRWGLCLNPRASDAHQMETLALSVQPHSWVGGVQMGLVGAARGW